MLPNVSCDTSQPQSPNTYTLTVDDYLNGTRIDKFLTRQFRNFTAFRMQRLVQSGMVSVDHQMAVINTRVFCGQTVCVRLLEPPDKLFTPEPIPLDVLYEDQWLLVLNKPAGLVTHPVSQWQSGTLCNALQFHLDQQTAARGILRPGIIHRLDRMTSGLLVVSKHHLAHRCLSIAFQERKVKKSYLALVHGFVERDAGTIDRPIGRVAQQDSILMSTNQQARDRKPAMTHFKVEHRWADATLLLVTPLTGRLHQVRVHLAQQGHPIVGDPFYATHAATHPAADQPTADQPTADHCVASATAAVGQNLPGARSDSRHVLHAAELSFRHPISGVPLQFTIRPPEDFMQALPDTTASPTCC